MIKTSDNYLKSGIYNISDLNSEIIIIGENENVVIVDFENISGIKKLELLENSNLEFYSIYELSGDYGVEIITKGNNTNSIINILNLSKETQINLSAIANLESNNSTSDIHIISLCGKNGKIKINSGINITSNTINCSGNILQENVFLGEIGKIIGIPALNIETNEAKANHALKIEKVNEKDLFYLESRGIDRKSATSLILDSKINELFTGKIPNYGEHINNSIERFLK
ncbi:MAG: SufD family Fe-S cluster assembly protein [Candidatus Gracilibacteria bacterium]|nr:SufD family Fe-S cluster assembly protein [Candidatus Gracilibacteria bacterium]MDD2909214.1 SufD family Fe-S cluster assembly protein [Candidatus Gracilibacteria bacterium]